MEENWCVLCISILKHTTPEQAFELYNKYNGQVNKSITQDDIKDMIKFREEGMTYNEIGEYMELVGELCAIELDTIKKKRGKENLCI